MRGRCRVGTEIGFARLQEVCAEKKITIYADNISQYVVQDNINTSPYKGFFIRPYTPLIIPIKLHTIHFFVLQIPLHPMKNSIPFVVEYRYFLQLYNSKFAKLE